MDSALEWHHAKALLAWQVELGADEAICDAPVDRFALERSPPRRTAPAEAHAPDVVRERVEPDAVEVARAAATGAATLAALHEALAAYEHCDLRQGARNTVFADGNPAARVMIVGEAPDRDEDREGRPFVGPAGQMLDRMFAAIGLSRTAEVPDRALYLANVLPWRPPRNRDPEAAEIAMMLPFLQKHVELADPEIVVIMGNIAAQAALGRRGILKLRGRWTEAWGRPAMPMAHPASLLRQPAAKREAWADLLAIRARLEG